MRSSWRDYLTQVPETSARQIKNFLLASLAEGRNDAADEAGGGGARLDSVACKIDVQDVRQILAKKKTKSLTAEMKETAQPDVNHARIDKATSIAAALIETQGLHTIVSKVATRTLHIASKHVRKFEAHGTETVAADIPDVFDGTGAREQSFTRIDWRDAYRKWRANLCEAEKQPYRQQWLILETVHDRCVREFIEAANLPSAMGSEILDELESLISVPAQRRPVC